MILVINVMCVRKTFWRREVSLLDSPISFFELQFWSTAEWTTFDELEKMSFLIFFLNILWQKLLRFLARPPSSNFQILDFEIFRHGSYLS